MKTEIERNNPLDLRNPLSTVAKDRNQGRLQRQLDALRNTSQQKQQATLFDILSKAQNGSK